MIDISQQQFESIVAEGIDRLPSSTFYAMDNVVILTADKPTVDQKKKAKIPEHSDGADPRLGWLLFGLYEGVPKTVRSSNYSFSTPDIITIFKKPFEAVSHSLEELRRRVHNTVWHEVAHHFGLNHDRIHRLEADRRQHRTI